jgi:2'-5' RNA ligase
MESTVAILVPEAEGLVRLFRNRYDPSAKAGMPAHITLLYPFKSPQEIDGLVLDTLGHCFSGFQPFKFSLTKINQFPGETLYLVPEPEDPFRELTLTIWRCSPETPPYRGRYSTVVPHLTVADHMGEPRLAEVAREFEADPNGSSRSRTDGFEIRPLGDQYDVPVGPEGLGGAVGWVCIGSRRDYDAAVARSVAALSCSSVERALPCHVAETSMGRQ